MNAAADVFLSYSRADAEAVLRVQASPQGGRSRHLPRPRPASRRAALAPRPGASHRPLWCRRRPGRPRRPGHLAAAARSSSRSTGRPSWSAQARTLPGHPCPAAQGRRPARRLPASADLGRPPPRPRRSRPAPTCCSSRHSRPARAGGGPCARRSAPIAACSPSARRMPACSLAARRRSRTSSPSSASTAIVTLVGRSGSGKSSVVYAGLIPALRRRADGRTWSILGLRPGAGAAARPRACLRPAPGRPAAIGGRPAHRAAGRILRTTTALSAAACRGLSATPDEQGTERLLLYVDQWEELYTQALRQSAGTTQAGRSRRHPLHRSAARRDATQPLHRRAHGPRRLLRRAS